MIKGFFYDQNQKSRNHTNVRDRAFRLRSKQANGLSAFIFNQNKKRVAIARPEGNAIKQIIL
jgi:hypothetical protein